jgi:hypothetical protein
LPALMPVILVVFLQETFWHLLNYTSFGPTCVSPFKFRYNIPSQCMLKALFE